jgi:hypothetical protein
LQEDFYLHSEPGGAFFPETAAELERITFTKIDTPIQCDGNFAFSSRVCSCAFFGAGSNRLNSLIHGRGEALRAVPALSVRIRVK